MPSARDLKLLKIVKQVNDPNPARTGEDTAKQTETGEKSEVESKTSEAQKKSELKSPIGENKPKTEFKAPSFSPENRPKTELKPPAALRDKPLKVEIASGPAPEAEQKTSDKPAEPSYFQAIGTLLATVERREGQTFIHLNDKEYRAYTPPAKYRAFCQFMETHDGSPLYLRVYPKTFVAPKVPLQLSGWIIIAWSKEQQPDQIANQFIIRGVWQFIPQHRSPVISVYRNRDAYDPMNKFKALHIPILMRREDCLPFRFNPKAEEQAKRYFVDGVFRFDLARECFLWKGDSAPPSDRLPYYRKPVKAGETPPPPPPPPKGNKKKSEQQEVKEVIMVNGRIPEISVKFTERPQIPESGKKIILQVTGENGVTVRAELNRKTLAKQIEKMDEFESWVAALSGRVVGVNEGTLELEAAGVTVFERKPRDEEAEQTSAEVEELDTDTDDEAPAEVTAEAPPEAPRKHPGSTPEAPPEAPPEAIEETVAEAPGTPPEAPPEVTEVVAEVPEETPPPPKKTRAKSTKKA
ncbi:MAG: hypothetical protein N5P05_002976 [Chroococcopsis gigantea SAG 12.99]|nr:hypothetical protein [Chroococcopsis gigantea SAG 12.99]